MKTELEIRAEIEKIKKDYHHILIGSQATVEVNITRASLQISILSQLDVLYWVLGEQFKHEWTKPINH